MPASNPPSYLAKIAERCTVSGEAQILAVKIFRKAKRRGVSSGKDPVSLAAAALYIACLEKGEPATQRGISNATEVTDVTVRNMYKALKSGLGLKLNSHARSLRNLKSGGQLRTPMQIRLNGGTKENG